MVSKKTKYQHLGLQICIFESITSKNAFSELIGADHFSILIVNSGFLSIQVNNRKINLSVNEMIVISSRLVCEVVVISDQLKISQLSFTSEFAFKNRIKWPHIGYFDFFITRFSTKIVLKNKEAIVLIDLFKLLNGKVQMSSEHVFKNEILLFSFNLLLYELAGLYKRSSREITVKHSSKEKLVMEFFKILEINCRKQHSVKFYSDTLHLTPGHLTKTVKEVAEKTAKQFIEESIVLEAKVLLQDNHLTILDITEELQFSNSSFFSNFFRRHTSLSPSEYRLRLNFH